MNTNSSRKRAFDGGDYGEYWLRSPNVDYANYIWRVDANGQTQGIYLQDGKVYINGSYIKSSTITASMLNIKGGTLKLSTRR